MRSLAHYITSRNDVGKILDEKTILFSVKKCIQEQYGTQGERNIQVISWKKGIVVVSIEKSIWKSEFFQQQEIIKQCCNKNFIPQKPIRKIVIQM
ncbi:MAG: hypothetical protein EOM19_02495 [Candidatus Moranbacteria bacterium]|nr:hypothetical protein [Candidatus Moranbacteria bacterium]